MFYRLPKKRRELLDLPELPDGHRWVLTSGKYARARIKRRILGVVPKTESSKYIYGGLSRKNYQEAVNDAWRQFTNESARSKRVVDSWLPVDTPENDVINAITEIATSRANLEKTAARHYA